MKTWPCFLVPAKRKARFVIGGGQVQQLNVNEFYLLGKQLAELEPRLSVEGPSAAYSDVMWPLMSARFRIVSLLDDPCPLLQSSQRAARAIISEINGICPEDIEEAFRRLRDEKIYGYQLSSIAGAIKTFETVLHNDMPEMSAYAVSQIGIYRTDDLIERSDRQISEVLRPLLPELALSDIREAGKCLAFRVHTAAAFHLSRAIETCMNLYYETIAGKPFAAEGAARNWSVKIKGLKEKGADVKITAFLDHLRDEYRNPVTHPDVVVDSGEAFNFFGPALSAVAMMLAAVKLRREKDQPSIPGLELGDGQGGSSGNALHGTSAKGALGSTSGDTEAA